MVLVAHLPGGGQVTDSSNDEFSVRSGGIGVPDESEIPAVFAVRGAVPNPFNPLTHIHFTLAEPGPARVEIFDVRGRRLWKREIPDAAAGPHSVRWNGVDASGRGVATGAYLARVSAGAERGVARLTLVR